MNVTAPRLHSLFIGAFVLGVGACAADGNGVGPAQNGNLVGVQENTADPITASYPLGTVLQTTTALNLRTGPSTSRSVLVVMPSGAHVATIEFTGPTNGFYRVEYGSTAGWAYGTYLRFVSTPAPSTTDAGVSEAGTASDAAVTPDASAGTDTGSMSGGPPPTPSAIDEAITRAQAGVGFSYWWGGGRWLASGVTSSTAGSCSGSCPGCSHAGTYGADCSGFVAKIWQVPSSNNDLSLESHPYSTVDFNTSTGGGQWSAVPRGSAQRGDALVYNQSGAGHIFLFESGDPWGSMWTYEARGCSYGIVHNLRTAGTVYQAIRRTGY